MKYNVQLVSQAHADVDHIVSFLLDRSPQGARTWLDRWEQVLADLRERPLIFGEAPESADHDRAIRQHLFKTRRGRMYRVLFVVKDKDVFVIHVRGPGEDLVSSAEISSIE